MFKADYRVVDDNGEMVALLDVATDAEEILLDDPEVFEGSAMKLVLDHDRGGWSIQKRPTRKDRNGVLQYRDEWVEAAFIPEHYEESDNASDDE